MDNMKYNVLFYNWGESAHTACDEVMRELGHHVVECREKHEKYDNDERFMLAVKKQISENSVDIIFSFNYFPDLSRVANDMGVRYVSWVFDSPHLTLESITLGNECNTVNLFDYALYEKYKCQGFGTVRYMPLACNFSRVEKYRNVGINRKYDHDISFVGRLYDDKNFFLKQVKYLPSYIEGYIDAAMEAQRQIYGMDLVDRLITPKISGEMQKYIELGLGENYRECRRDVLVTMIQKGITVKERRSLLTVLGEHYKVDHYSDVAGVGIPVNFMGYAEYMNQMPQVFASSKINLNITLRSIQTGIPLRVIDILGVGGFCISNYQAELAEYFENDKSIVWYESYEDLFMKVDYYLKHDNEREEIAARGYEIAKELFDYHVLLPKVLES